MNSFPNLSRHDLPPSAFPFTIELVRVDTLETVWSRRVEGSGNLQIPGLGAQLGVTLMARVTLPDGAVFEEVLSD